MAQINQNVQLEDDILFDNNRLTLKPSRKLPFKCCNLFNTLKQTEYIIEGTLSYITKKSNHIFKKCCDAPVKPVVLQPGTLVNDDDPLSGELLFDNKKNFTNSKTAEKESYIIKDTKREDVISSLSFTSIVYTKKLMVISNGVKLVSTVSKGYETLLPQDLSQKIEAGAVRDQEVFLRATFTKNGQLNRSYFCVPCGDRSILYKSDHLETVHEHTLKQHDLDKTLTKRSEASTLCVLQHFTDFLHDNQCRTFNLNGTLALEKIRELKTGTNYARYDNAKTLMKTYLKMMDSSFYHNLDGPSGKKVVIDINCPVLVDELRRVCIFSNPYGATVDGVEQGKAREHYLGIKIDTTDFNPLLKSRSVKALKAPYKDLKYGKTLSSLAGFSHLPVGDTEKTKECIVNALNNLNDTEHNAMYNLFTLTSDNAAVMIAVRNEMTSEYKVLGIACLSHAMNNIFENMSSCFIMNTKIKGVNNELEIYELPLLNNDLNELYEKATNEGRKKDLQSVNGLSNGVIVSDSNSEVIMRFSLPMDDDSNTNVGPEADTSHEPEITAEGLNIDDTLQHQSENTEENYENFSNAYSMCFDIVQEKLKDEKFLVTDDNGEQTEISLTDHDSMLKIIKNIDRTKSFTKFVKIAGFSNSNKPRKRKHFNKLVKKIFKVRWTSCDSFLTSAIDAYDAFNDVELFRSWNVMFTNDQLDPKYVIEPVDLVCVLFMKKYSLMTKTFCLFLESKHLNFAMYKEISDDIFGSFIKMAEECRYLNWITDEEKTNQILYITRWKKRYIDSFFREMASGFSYEAALCGLANKTALINCASIAFIMILYFWTDEYSMATDDYPVLKSARGTDNKGDIVPADKLRGVYLHRFRAQDHTPLYRISPPQHQVERLIETTSNSFYNYLNIGQFNQLRSAYAGSDDMSNQSMHPESSIEFCKDVNSFYFICENELKEYYEFCVKKYSELKSHYKIKTDSESILKDKFKYYATKGEVMKTIQLEFILKYPNSFMTFLLRIGLSSQLTSSALEQAFSIVKKSNTEENQTISPDSRGIKARMQYALKKRVNDGKRRKIPEAVYIGEDRLKKYHVLVRQNDT